MHLVEISENLNLAIILYLKYPMYYVHYFKMLECWTWWTCAFIVYGLFEDKMEVISSIWYDFECHVLFNTCNLHILFIYKNKLNIKRSSYTLSSMFNYFFWNFPYNSTIEKTISLRLIWPACREYSHFVNEIYLAYCWPTVMLQHNLGKQDGGNIHTVSARKKLSMWSTCSCDSTSAIWQ